MEYPQQNHYGSRPMYPHSQPQEYAMVQGEPDTLPLQGYDQQPHDQKPDPFVATGPVPFQPPVKRPRPGIFGIVDGWLVEFATLLFSWLFQVAVVIVLLRMNDRPLDWWGGSISLNAVIALFATLARSVLLFPVASAMSQLKWIFLEKPQSLRDFELFDQASRGPFGSLLFLVKMPFYLASLGALVTIVASAIGPFTQQIIQLDTRIVENPNSTVSFGVTYSYDTNTPLDAAGLPANTDADFTMRGAFMKALYNLDLTPDFNCTSSSCTWDSPVVTLGFSSTCQNVTKATMATRKCFNVANGTAVKDEYSYDSSYNCTMTTPGNVTITTMMIQTMQQTTQYVGSNTSTEWNPATMSVSNLNGTFGPDFMRVAQYLAEDRSNNVTGYYDSNVTECTISLAAWELAGVSAQGNTFSVEKTTMIPLPAGQIYRPGTSIIKPTYVVFNATGLPSMSVKAYDWASLTRFMMAQLTNMTAYAGDEQTVDPAAASPLFAVSSLGNITTVMERATRSLTNTLRSDSTKQLVYGNSAEPVIFVRVVWVWFILPLAAEVAATFLVLFTVIRSAAGPGTTPLWKSSALAVLLHDIRPAGPPPGPEVLVTTAANDMMEVKHLSRRIAQLQ